MTYYYYGTIGNDYFNYTGSDNLWATGYSGNDYIYGNYYNDTLLGMEGNDSLLGYYGDDYLNGWSGNDYLHGGSGNDEMYGSTGNDTLDGNEGNDLISGYGNGTEYDTLAGGSGSDTFVLGNIYSGVSYRGSGYALITDWNRSYDYLQVSGSASQYSLRSGNWAGSSTRDMGIYYGNDLIAVLQDTTNVTLNTHDFIFV